MYNKSIFFLFLFFVLFSFVLFNNVLFNNGELYAQDFSTQDKLDFKNQEDLIDAKDQEDKDWKAFNALLKFFRISETLEDKNATGTAEKAQPQIITDLKTIYFPAFQLNIDPIIKTYSQSFLDKTGIRMVSLLVPNISDNALQIQFEESFSALTELKLEQDYGTLSKYLEIRIIMKHSKENQMRELLTLDYELMNHGEALGDVQFQTTYKDLVNKAFTHCRYKKYKEIKLAKDDLILALQKLLESSVSIQKAKVDLHVYSVKKGVWSPLVFQDQLTKYKNLAYPPIRFQIENEEDPSQNYQVKVISETSKTTEVKTKDKNGKEVSKQQTKQDIATVGNGYTMNHNSALQSQDLSSITSSGNLYVKVINPNTSKTEVFQMFKLIYLDKDLDSTERQKLTTLYASQENLTEKDADIASETPRFTITLAKMTLFFPHANKDVLETYTHLINLYMNDFGINDKETLAYFLAQVGVETGGFTKKFITEGTIYSTVAGLRTNFVSKTENKTDKELKVYLNNKYCLNYLYAREDLGNGDSASGDGYKYRGRGIIQITGRANYQEFSDELNKYFKVTDIDLVNNPELLSNNEIYATVSALLFFKKRIINKNKIAKGIDEVTKAVNGGTNGAIERKNLYEEISNTI